MGGGIGLMAGGAARVVTETSVLAMPEITIGLFPDVGMSFFLNRMPGKLGLFVALTAARLNAADAIYARLADVFVPQAELDSLVAALEEHEWTGNATFDRAAAKSEVARFAAAFAADAPKAQAPARQDAIDAALAGTDPAAALSRLAALAASDDPWLAKAAATFAKGSPTSAFVIHEQLKRGRDLSLDETFEQDLAMGRNFLRRHDFLEGVRALLIDKDQSPSWDPPTRERLTREIVQAHFNT
jgi:enoyl-CoA hydratase/carnithine racemase